MRLLVTNFGKTSSHLAKRFYSSAKSTHGSTSFMPPRLFGNSSMSSIPVISSIDCHCGGLPARVVVHGVNIPGNSAMERRVNMMTHHDDIRKLMLTEPRGYPCQNVNFVFPPTPSCPEAAYSYVIAENNFIYPSMSGHNTICVVTALIESGMVKAEYPQTKFVLEAPCGPIHITATCDQATGKCVDVTFKNVPSFVREQDMGVVVDVPGGVGKVTVDIAWGGMWYAVVDGPSIGLQVTPDEAGDIVRLGEMIKVATREQHPVSHPLIDYDGCDIMAIRGPPSKEGNEKYGATARNAVVMSTGKLDWNKTSTWKGNIDRSPCGTGTCAIMATMHARGELGINEDFVHESVIGSIFTGRLIEETSLRHPSGEVAVERAVVPTVKGSAWVTQCSSVCVDPSDPFPSGYTLGDIWSS